jgi:hypothetical protein
MPIRESEQAQYPKHWPTIRARILRRAEDRCEFECADGTRCNAPNYAIVFRNVVNLEDWVNGDAERIAVGCWNPVKVVLTIAHLNHDPADCRDENLKAGCQLHHLRYDVDHHKKTAAATRRSQKQNGELF